MDYGRELTFGISVVPMSSELQTSRELVHLADATGLDLVGIQDHPYQWRFLDTLSLIGSLLATTERIHIFPDVANLPLRHPALLAKEGASLDVLSRGRFELGLGAGSFWDAVVAMGGPRRTPGEAVEALEEAIAIIRQAWSDSRSVGFSGNRYQVRGYHAGPKPAHAVEIWVGAYRPRMLRLIGRLADGWIPSLGSTRIDELARMHLVIDDAARGAGRAPSVIRRMLNIAGAIGADAGGISGSADDWVKLLSDWATQAGFDSFILWPAIPEPGQIEAWGGEIAPRVRREVARQRALRAA